MRSTDIERDVAASFSRDVDQHQLVVHLDHGLHRHLVFRGREHSWNCWFELITAPGSLTITSDHGAYTFRRLTDMFQFFRCNGDTYGINPHYWAEKLPDGGRSVRTYSEYALQRQLKQELHELAEDYRRELAEWRAEAARYGEDAGDKPVMPEVLRRAREVVCDARVDGLTFREEADILINDLQRIGAAEDAWEWNLSDWDFHFLWCLHAIAWGIRQYDRAVKSGLHVVRTGTMAWDTPLPTTAPVMLKRQPTPIRATVTLRTAGVR